MALTTLLGIAFVTCLVLFGIDRLVTDPPPPRRVSTRKVLFAITIVLAVLVILNGIGVFRGTMRVC